VAEYADILRLTIAFRLRLVDNKSMEAYPSIPLQAQRRQYFRVSYPDKLCPVVIILGHAFTILDICEKGIRFSNPLNIKVPEDLFMANVKLHEGVEIAVSARVVRKTRNQVALVLVRGIPYQKIIAEQAFLRKQEQVRM
jgi:hypothetical protein